MKNKKINKDGEILLLKEQIKTLRKSESEFKKVEEELRESGAKYRSLFEGSLHPVTIYDRNANIVMLNKIGAENLKKSLHEIIGKPLGKFIPEAHEITVKRICQVLKTRKPLYVEDEISLPGGGKHWFLSTLHPILYPKGYPNLVQVISYDITARKRAEESLRDSRNMLQVILDSIPVGVFWKDRDLIYLGGNRTFLEAIGLKDSEEVAGKNDYDLPWEKKQADSFREDDRRIMESGIPEYEITEPYLRADGTQAWATTNKVPLRDLDDNIAGILGTYEDITKSQRMENQLRESEELHRLTLSNISDAVFLTDNHGHFTYVCLNADNIFGFTADEIRKMKNISKLLGENLFNMNTLKSKKEIRNIERVIKDKAGKTHTLLINAKSASIKGGDVLYTCRDITERMLAEAELKQSHEKLRNLSMHIENVREKEREKIAYNLHDDLGQKLTALNMDLDWIRYRLPKYPPQLSVKLNSMVKLLDETTKSVQKIATELRPSILNDLGLIPAIEWQLNEFRDNTGIKYKVKIIPEELMIDQEISISIFRIIQESLTNIARHANASNVDVTITEKNEILKIKIKDDGVGILKEDIDNPKSFGLMGIRERVKSCGGKVLIKGENGKGTEIYLEIPVV